MRTDLPHVARLTPDRPPEAPEGFSVVDSPIRGGLPHVVPLLPRWRAVLSLPTGSALHWVEAPDGAPVTTGAPRLRLQRDGVTACVVPLVLGEPVAATDGGRVPLRLVVLAWALHAGDLRGPGDRGSFVRLAVTAADRAAHAFGPLPLSDFVIEALPPADRTESRPGPVVPLRYHRLKALRVLRRVEVPR